MSGVSRKNYSNKESRAIEQWRDLDIYEQRWGFCSFCNNNPGQAFAIRRELRRGSSDKLVEARTAGLSAS
jgi:hypothetical protein